jgi:hypothetical protein
MEMARQSNPQRQEVDLWSPRTGEAVGKEERLPLDAGFLSGLTEMF